MKKIAIFLILGFVTVSLQAQTKSGTVFSEHPNIETTKAVMKALQEGDQDSFLSFFADTVYQETNGKGKIDAKETLNGILKYWTAFDNLKIRDAKPAYPDAIEYKDGGTWVQDWLLITAIHKKTGINVEEPFHHIYRFNDDGKIDVFIGYFNNDIFQEIGNSQTKKENGKVYINHPYINTVRKAMNAICAKDLDTWSGFFAPNVKFSNSMMQWGETFGIEELKEFYINEFAQTESIKMKEVGYPDCIYYSKGDNYVVYSWYVNTTVMKDGTVREYPVMFSSTFNKDGKIVYSRMYASSNHLE